MHNNVLSLIELKAISEAHGSILQLSSWHRIPAYQIKIHLVKETWLSESRLCFPVVCYSCRQLVTLDLDSDTPPQKDDDAVSAGMNLDLRTIIHMIHSCLVRANSSFTLFRLSRIQLLSDG